jgi:hypothetical protein
MCQIDSDEQAEVWTDKLIGKARKEHTCDMCHGAISPGGSYLHHFSVFDGDVTSERQCIQCCTIVAAFRREHRTWFCPSGMRDMLIECLDEDSYRGDADDGEDERVPITESALRWKHALVEMRARGDARQQVTP